MELRRWGMAVAGLGAALVTVTVLRSLPEAEPERLPVPITEAVVAEGNRVEIRIDRCDSDPDVTQTSLAANRLVVEVTAGEGSSSDCRDTVEVATVTDDIVVLQDLTSGTLFILRSVPTEPSDRTPGTRE